MTLPYQCFMTVGYKIARLHRFICGTGLVTTIVFCICSMSQNKRMNSIHLKIRDVMDLAGKNVWRIEASIVVSAMQCADISVNSTSNVQSKSKVMSLNIKHTMSYEQKTITGRKNTTSKLWRGNKGQEETQILPDSLPRFYYRGSHIPQPNPPYFLLPRPQIAFVFS